MDEREKNLPKWAQEHLYNLRLAHRAALESTAKELATLRPQVELLKRSLAGMQELLECAAKGGHLTAAQIVDTLAGYSLTLTKED